MKCGSLFPWVLDVLNGQTFVGMLDSFVWPGLALVVPGAPDANKRLGSAPN